MAWFADIAELVLAAARVLLRDESNPGREIPSRSKCLGITNARDQSGCQRGADTRDGVKSLAGLVRSVPCHDAAIEGQDLGFQCQQLSPESSHAPPPSPRATRAPPPAKPPPTQPPTPRHTPHDTPAPHTTPPTGP